MRDSISETIIIIDVFIKILNCGVAADTKVSKKINYLYVLLDVKLSSITL
jgi:hypothetical protein